MEYQKISNVKIASVRPLPSGDLTIVNIVRVLSFNSNCLDLVQANNQNT